MEGKEHEKIFSNLDKLVGLTECNAALLAILLSTKILGPSDVDHLLSIPRMVQRTYAFYRIIITRVGAYQQLLQALQQTGQTEAFKILKQETSSGFHSSLSEATKKELVEQTFQKSLKSLENTECISFDVRDPCTIFTGRQEELENLHQMLTQSEPSSTLKSNIVCVSGLGGIGKTQLACKYIQLRGSHFNYNVIWINAESSESLSLSFRRLAADVLGISTKNADGKDKCIKPIVHECYQYFSSSKCLFVFDNVENGDNLHPYLPLNRQQTKVLITSRLRDWGPAVQAVHLEALKEAEAIAFVMKGLNISDEGKILEIKLLAQRLQCFPLAMQQAISYILNENVLGDYTIAEYLEEFKQRSLKLLDSSVPTNFRLDYNKTTFRTWEVTVDKISSFADYGTLAVDILETMAYFESSRIPCETLMHIETCAGGRSEEKVKAAVRLLVKYSMIDLDRSKSWLCVHPLVQKVMRSRIQNNGNLLKVLRQALSIFCIHLNATNIVHAISVWKYTEKIPELVKDFSILPSKIMKVLNNELRMKEALRFGTDSLREFEKALGKNHLSVLEFEEALSQSYLLCEKFNRSFFHFSRMYGRKVAMYGERSETALRTQVHVGTSLYFSQDPIRGFEMYLSACSELEKIVGISDAWLLKAYNAMVEIGCNEGQFELATGILERVLAAQMELQGSNHIDVKLTRMGLGVIKANEGYVEGVNILRELYSELDFSQDVSVDVRAYIIEVSLNFATQLINYDFFSEGHQVSQNLYEFCRRWWEESHTATLASRKLIATALLGLSKPHEAYQIFKNIYPHFLHEFGENHILTLELLGTMALSFLQKRNHPKALSLFNKVFQHFGDKSESYHMQHLKLQLNYGITLEASGCQDQAEKVFGEFKQSWGRRFGDKHPIYNKCVKAITRVQADIKTNWLRQKVFDLLNSTKCSPSLITRLTDVKFLNDADIEKLTATGITEQEKTLELYEILNTRLSLYDLLVKALFSERQTKAYGILQQATNKFIHHTSKILFRNPLKYIVEFLAQNDQDIMIIYTPDPEISLKRIHDTMQDKVIIHDKRSGPVTGALMSSSDAMGLVISTQKLGATLFKILGTTKKVVLLTELQNSKIVKIAQSFKLEYILAEDKISWQDLHKNAQDHILNQPIIIQAEVHHVNNLTPLVFAVAEIQGTLLFDLLNGKCPELVNSSVPGIPSLCWPRDLLVARKVSPDIFKNKDKDIVAIKGIDFNELAKLASDQLVQKSSKYLKHPRSRFIQLESDKHFDTFLDFNICPVHLLSHQNGIFTWLRSFGSVEVISRYILHKEAEVMDEDEFVNEIILSQNSQSVCIADSQGMGKSILLAKIGNAIMQKRPESLVLHVVLRELIPDLVYVNLDSVCDLIASFSSDYELGKKYVLTALKTKHIRCYVLLDGHGETPTAHEDRVIKLIQCLHGLSDEDTKLIITTRPHNEAKINGLLDNPVIIRTAPVSHQGQVDVLVRFWYDHGALKNNQNQLLEFAEACISHLKNEMTDFETGLAGPQFLCQLIARAYCYEAVKYSELEPVPGMEQRPPVNTAASILELYELYVKFSFRTLQQMFAKSKRSGLLFNLFGKGESESFLWENINRAHMYYAIQEIYPEMSNRFQGKLFQKMSPRLKSFLKMVYTIDVTKADNKFRFVHKSVAQYIVATFIIECMGFSKAKFRKSYINFLFGTILETINVEYKIMKLPNPTYENHYHWLQSPTFLQSNRSVCYFLNGLLQSKSGLVEGHLQMDNWLIGLPPNINKPLFASVLYEFRGIVSFLMCMLRKVPTEVKQQVHWAELLVLASNCSTVKCMTDLCESLKYFKWLLPNDLYGAAQNKYEPFTLTPLHVAAKRGDVNLVRFLLTEGGFHYRLNEENEDGHYFFHACIFESLGDPPEIINNKKIVINLLREYTEKSHRLELNRKLAERGLAETERNVHQELISFLANDSPGKPCEEARRASSTSKNESRELNSSQQPTLTKCNPNFDTTERELLEGNTATKGSRLTSIMTNPLATGALTNAEDAGQIESSLSHDTLKSLIVGSAECPLNQVRDVLTTRLTVGTLSKNLVDVAIKLGIPEDTRRIIQTQLSQTGSYHMACHDILQAWTSQKGTRATLEVLGEALTKSNENAAYEDLLNNFSNVML